MAHNSNLLHPVDIIAYFVSSEGRTSNMQLVKNFRQFLQGSEGVSTEAPAINKSLLKMVTGHIANVRRQGTREINRRDGQEGGKMIVLKNKFNGKTADEIWSTLILSLPIDEINRMTPREENVIKNDESTIEKESDKLDTNIDAVKITKVQKVKEVCFENELETQKPDNDEGNVLEEKQDTLKEDISEIDKRKSVRDLKKAYDDYANESMLSLADHHTDQMTDQKPVSKSRRPKSSNGFDKWIPLTREGHAWILSATRGDYQTMARLAKSDPQLVNIHDPATGYTALHWAAKQGHADVVKLLAGSYSQDPDIKTRGGYTPLMLAGMCKREEVFDLLVKAYNADDDIRDFSGCKARQYLEQHHMNIPGFPPPMDLSHDMMVRSRSLHGTDNVRKSRTKVARSATHHFMKELRESVRDVRGSIRSNIKTRPKSIGE